MTRIVLILVVLAVVAGRAAAQAHNPATPASRSAGVALGFDHGAVIELASRLPAPRLRDASLHLRWQVPSAPGLGDGGIEGGVSIGRVNARGLGVTATTAATVRWVDGELLGLAQGGLALGGAAGYFRRRGLVSAELVWDHALLTYARPTAAYRRRVYADATAGVHGSGGGTLRAGIAAGVALTHRFAVGMRAGYVVTERLGVVPGLPFQAMLGGAVRF